MNKTVQPIGSNSLHCIFAILFKLIMVKVAHLNDPKHFFFQNSLCETEECFIIPRLCEAEKRGGHSIRLSKGPWFRPPTPPPPLDSGHLVSATPPTVFHDCF